MNKFNKITQKLRGLIKEWESVLTQLSPENITQPRNVQGRSIKQIVGHWSKK